MKTFYINIMSQLYIYILNSLFCIVQNHCLKIPHKKVFFGESLHLPVVETVESTYSLLLVFSFLQQLIIALYKSPIFSNCLHSFITTNSNLGMIYCHEPLPCLPPVVLNLCTCGNKMHVCNINQIPQ